MGKRASSIELSKEEREYLELQTRARTIQAQTVTRARILLLRADAVSIDAIADKVGLNRCSVMLCLKKFKEGGIENALSDAPGRGRNAEITDEEKAWIINIACQKPIDFGYAAETWTYAKLTSHINKTAEEAGYTRLSTIHKSTVNTILAEADIKPHKITYYCENRDPDFDSKMHNVLLVYAIVCSSSVPEVFSPSSVPFSGEASTEIVMESSDTETIFPKILFSLLISSGTPAAPSCFPSAASASSASISVSSVPLSCCFADCASVLLLHPVAAAIHNTIPANITACLFFIIELPSFWRFCFLQIIYTSCNSFQV